MSSITLSKILKVTRFKIRIPNTSIHIKSKNYKKNNYIYINFDFNVESIPEYLCQEPDFCLCSQYLRFAEQFQP